MSSNSADALGPDPPSPESLHELIDALKTACGDVVAARRQVASDCKSQVEELRDDAERIIASAKDEAEGHLRAILVAIETATRKLADLDQRASVLEEKLNGELAETEIAVRHLREARKRWEAESDPALQELVHALADEKARVNALEAANERLLAAQASLDERLAVVEKKKKIFGLF
jgi:chromosome segregation ATPase